MTIKDQIRHILRKHENTKFNRGEFMWAYCQEYLGINIGLSRTQFLEFWEHEAGLERALRDVLLEEEFKLEPKADSKRYEKQAEYKKEFQPSDPQEAKDYNKVFNQKYE